MTHVSVALPDELDEFVRQQIESGAFASADDVVIEALRRLAADAELSDQDRLEVLRHALKPGLADIASGRLSDRATTDFLRDAKRG
jgi:putative addiction module CopG family antidote